MTTYDEAFNQSLKYFDGDELAAQVFLGKYALITPEGEVLEATPDDMHRRLAKEFARIESRYENPLSEEEIFSYLKNFRYIIPQGSPMAGIGNPYQIMSLSNCFVEGTKVHTRSGVKNIEDVDLGDEVLTHKGRYRRVVQLHKNKLNGRQLYALKAYRTPEIKVTGNHELMSISKEQLAWGKKPQFNPIQYLRVGDYIQVPNNVENEEIGQKTLDIFSMFKDGFKYGSFEYKAIEGRDDFTLVTLSKDGKLRPHNNPTPKSLAIDKNFAYFLGLWYGDGCVFGENDNSTKSNKRNRKSKVCTKVQGLTFTFGSHETKLIDFTTQFLEKNKIKYDLNENPKGNTIQIAIHNSALGYAFEEYFGRRFDGKKLNASIHSWNKSLVASLLQGLVDSDGTITKQGDVRVVMSNRSFIEEVYHLARSFNFLVGFSASGKVARLDFGRNDKIRNESLKSYTDNRISTELSNKTNHFVEIDGVKFVQILSKKELSETPDCVYTFGVEEDHSYSVEGLIAKNCFVIESPFDSYGGILKADQEEAQLMKRRGGVGFDISTIRPRGMLTSNAAKTTDGIGVFMERFSNTCREVGQGGRRGALMLTISVHHPEIKTFINIKRDLKKVTGANISVRLSDEFMQAVKENKKVHLRWPVDQKENPKIESWVDANELWTEIIQSAHASAEPGLLFWDTVKKWSPADAYESVGFGTTSTNPCGEITLSPYDSCRLLLVNVVSFVKNPFTPNAHFDWEKYAEVVQVAQKLMDDIIDLELECIDKILAKINADPEPEEVKQDEINLWKKIKQSAVNGRRTGLGVTAIGDAVAAMNVTYGSDASVELIESIYRELALNSYRSSVKMAKERGPFPVYNHELEKNHPFINNIMNLDQNLRKDWEQWGRRNIANTTTAPAGSVSVLSQTTSGIEPAFLLSYTRRRKINSNDQNIRVDFIDSLGDKWQEYIVYHHWFKKWMEISGKTKVEESPYHGATSNDINWVNKVKAQAAAQKWICHSISNTTNVPEETSVDVIKDIYMTGWETGCKGVTVYRDKCRTGVLVSDTGKSRSSKFVEHDAPKRPERLPCDIYHMQVRGEKWNFFVGLFEDKPYEIFAGRTKHIQLPKNRKTGVIKKNGSYNLYTGEGENQLVIEDLATIFENTTESAFTRTVSLALRHGVPIQYLVEQIEKGADKDNEMFSLAKGLMRVLKNYIKDGTKPTAKKCPECGSKELAYQEGCLTCQSCGYSKCG